MSKSKKPAIDSTLLATLTANLQGYADEANLSILLARMIDHFGPPLYSEHVRNMRNKNASLFAMHQWPHTKREYLTLSYTEEDGLSFLVTDDDGCSEHAPMWHLPIKPLPQKKKKVKDNVLTPTQYNEFVTHLSESPGTPDAQALHLRDLLSKMLGKFNSAGGEHDGSGFYAWSSGNAELVLGHDKDGLTLKLKDMASDGLTA